MKVVLDASAALAAVLGHESSAEIMSIVAGASIVSAPEIFPAEVTSGLWKYVTAGRLSAEDAGERLETAFKLVGQLHSVRELAQEVLREAAARRHSVYDFCYVVLARREGAAIVTIDTRLRKLLASMHIVSYP